MTLIAGVDSSTQSTKVEVRDADSGRLIGHGWVRAIGAPSSEAGDAATAGRA